MILSRVEVFCLNEICDDYENIEIIKKGVSDSLNQSVTIEELSVCLKRLEKENLLNTYKYDQKSKRFNKINHPNDANISDMWFLINKQGRHELDLNWERCKAAGKPGT